MVDPCPDKALTTSNSNPVSSISVIECENSSKVFSRNGVVQSRHGIYFS